ncbi:MerR family transcriptional regulator [Streptomyces sp. NPDC090106]|uniref:MerR family transcriptional regulator n=1 Tax=Streptomyces sp. NPDC090106 TaxID=3365946 RepID=UPI003817D256
MLTIGAFAKACRLTPKALRLYDDLDLLRPARVDPETGYRYYTPDQLPRARLVAWLRRVGMPLARIREVCALGPGAAAAEIRAYWERVEAETAERRDLAGFLVAHLASADTAPAPGLRLRCAAASDRGRVRAENQDTAYAGPGLLAVADGYGPEGERASGAAVDALRHLEPGLAAAGDVLTVLEEATEAVRGVPGTGTTLTALIRTDAGALALVHIGDSRAYLLRAGGLFRITQDHTLVQSLVDAGRLTPEEAATHPQRALLLKALGTAPPDLRFHEPVPGDRYLLCTDGLTTAVPESRLREILTTAATPEDAVHALITTTNTAGAPDNVCCAVADVLAVS